MLNVVKVQILNSQTQFCDKYFGDMIVYGTEYLKVVKSVCI